MSTRAQQVWMIHTRTGMDGVEGTLVLTDDALVFEPMGGKSAETVLPLRALAHIKRAVGSPVLEVSVELPNAPKRIGFYFMKPPQLADKNEGFRLFQRYLAKRRAIGLLRRGNVDRGQEVSRWVQRVRAAKGTSDQP
jgi:hypothetical protein